MEISYIDVQNIGSDILYGIIHFVDKGTMVIVKKVVDKPLMYYTNFSLDRKRFEDILEMLKYVKAC